MDKTTLVEILRAALLGKRVVVIGEDLAGTKRREAKTVARVWQKTPIDPGVMLADYDGRETFVRLEDDIQIREVV